MAWWLDALYGPTLGAHYLWRQCGRNGYGSAAAEKWGWLSLPPAAGPRVWIHAVSVGEAMAAKPLWDSFAAAVPAADLRLSVTTTTGRAVAEKRYGADRVAYYPLDFSGAVRRWFDAAAPDLVVLMELEVWPHFLEEAARRGIPVAVANARITERSERRFRRLGGAARRLLGRVTLWLAQSEAYRARLTRLGVPEERIEVVGSLKFDAVATDFDPGVRADYRRLLGADNAPLVMAGSTHRGEEEAVLGAWRTLRGDFPALRLLLVPRHPERVDEVERLARTFGTVRRRSALPAPADDDPSAWPIVLGDTMGELSRLYAAADAVFVGGSFAPKGGQNVLEPCGIGRPTVMGPSRFNFAGEWGVLRAADGVVEIEAPANLAAAWGRLLRDPGEALAMGERARRAILEHRGATARTVERLTALLRKKG